MKDKMLKIADIARITGLSELEVRSIVRMYDDVLPRKKLGKVSLYGEKAADLVGTIADLTAHGYEPEEIQKEIGAGKTARRGAPRHRPNEPLLQPETDIKSRIPPSPTPQPAVEREITGLREMQALHASQIKNLIRRIEQLEKELESHRREMDTYHSCIDDAIANHQLQLDSLNEWISHFDARIESFSDRQDDLHGSIAEWIEYFDGELDEMNRPFWEKIRKKR